MGDSNGDFAVGKRDQAQLQMNTTGEVGIYSQGAELGAGWWSVGGKLLTGRIMLCQTDLTGFLLKQAKVISYQG